MQLAFKTPLAFLQKQHSGIRRVWAGPCMTAVAVATLSGCGGGGATDAAPTPAPVRDSALAVAQQGDLVAYFKARLQQRAAQGITASDGLAAVASPSPATGAMTFAGTPVQEQGVDEDDLLKTDGTMIYALHPAFTVNGETSPHRLSAQRRQADGTLAARATTTLNPEYKPRGMYLASSAGRIAVLGQRDGYEVIIAGTSTSLVMPPVVPTLRKLSLDLFALAADTGRPSQTSRVEIDGTLVGSRMIGNVLYVVSQWVPDVSRYQMPAGATAAQAAAVLAGLTAGELLPTIRVDGAAPQPLVSETDCLVQPANASAGLQLTTITAFDLSTPGAQRSSRCFVGGVDALYTSPAHVYLASSRDYWVAGDAGTTLFPPAVRTDIHKFALQGLQVDYRGSGEVAGHLGWDQEKKPYRMSEYQGDLRVLSFTGQSGWVGVPATITTAAQAKAASPATLTVLRESSAERRLQPVATLPNSLRPAPLGHAGEQVYAVQFAGPQAYLVTFRRTDPLYVLDLSSPTDPKTVGELTMPGYSDYLYPLAGGKLLGVGKDATADGRVLGLKVALFDVANPAKPAVLASRTLGDAGSSSALDYTRHGINLFTQGAQVHVALPVRVNETIGGVLRTRYQGLARYTVDTTAGTLAERALVPATTFDGTGADAARYSRYDLATERSVQMGTGAYYLSGGEVIHSP